MRQMACLPMRIQSCIVNHTSEEHLGAADSHSKQLSLLTSSRKFGESDLIFMFGFIRPSSSLTILIDTSPNS